MPASLDNRRLVTYVPVDIAAEVDRRPQADGRTVSGWLARVIAEALGARGRRNQQVDVTVRGRGGPAPKGGSGSAPRGTPGGA